MKVFYTCDYCGKRYEKEADCLACEELHREEKARQEKLLADKADRTAEIKEVYSRLMTLISAYNRDYKEPAEVPFMGAMDKVLTSLFRSL